MHMAVVVVGRYPQEPIILGVQKGAGRTCHDKSLQDVTNDHNNTGLTLHRCRRQHRNVCGDLTLPSARSSSVSSGRWESRRSLLKQASLREMLSSTRRPPYFTHGESDSTKAAARATQSGGTVSRT